MNSKATLKHISRALGISISTVSRALKDHPDIADHTKRRVREVAEMLDYEPNTLAVQLRTNASHLIGVIVPEISGFFYHSFIAAVEEEARSWGYSLMILQSNDDPERELANLRLCRFNRAAGILVAMSSETVDLGHFIRIRDAGMPVVFFDKVPQEKGWPKVSVADAEAGYLAAEALIGRRPGRVLAVFGAPSLSITRKRQKAFLGTFRRDAPGTPLETAHARNSAEARGIAAAALESGESPDAIFAMSDEILSGVMKALQAARKRVPDEVFVLGISNGFIPSLYDPEIPYVETSGSLLGRKSFEVLHRCISGNPPSGDITIPARLVAP